eukprot:403354443
MESQQPNHAVFTKETLFESNQILINHDENLIIQKNIDIQENIAEQNLREIPKKKQQYQPAFTEEQQLLKVRNKQCDDKDIKDSYEIGEIDIDIISDDPNGEKVDLFISDDDTNANIDSTLQYSMPLIPINNVNSNNAYEFSTESDQQNSTDMMVDGRLSRVCQNDKRIKSQTISGFMEKNSPKLLIGWQKRFFELKEGKLSYYKNHEIKGVINFDLVDCQIKSNLQKYRIDLKLAGISRIFKLKCQEHSDYIMWTEALQLVIKSSKGYLNKLFIDEKNLSVKSWRFDRIDEKAFLKTADVGDILLFRGRKFGHKITRGYTSSKFDDVFLFELEKFVKTVVGNKYHLPIKKLLFERNSFGKTLEGRKFFCSELIAKAYKEMGVLDTQIGCHQFMPNDFCSKGKIKMKIEKDAMLGEELMIQFDEDDVNKEREKLGVGPVNAKKDQKSKKKQVEENKQSQISTSSNSQTGRHSKNSQ